MLEKANIHINDYPEVNVISRCFRGNSFYIKCLLHFTKLLNVF